MKILQTSDNLMYRVKLKNDYEILYVGTLYECERWIHTDGKMDVTYEIEKVRGGQANELNYASRI